MYKLCFQTEINGPKSVKLFHEQLGAKYIDAVLRSLEERFSENSFVRHLAIFDFRNWTDAQDYGTADIKAVALRLCQSENVSFKEPTMIPNDGNLPHPEYSNTEHTLRSRVGRPLLSCTGGELLLEWNQLRYAFGSRRLEKTSSSFLNFLHSEEAASYPHLRSLGNIILSIPCTSVEAERQFSALKLVKTRLKSKMTAKTLQACLLIRQKKTLAESEVDDVIRAFFAMSPRAIECPV